MRATAANQTAGPMTLSLTPLPTPAFSLLTQGTELSGQAVHIHCVDIRQFTAAHWATAERIMNPAERARAQKFARGKESYIASRWLLRHVLARYTGQAPGAVEFLRTDKGKPYLSQSDIHFSLSHSGAWVVLAASKIELIGIDIEVFRVTRDLCNIAENYYHPREFARLKTLDSTAQVDYFYRLWTLKEAFFKATGTGISAGLEKIEFELADNEISAQLAPELGNCADAWHFYQWTPSALVYCALASKSSKPLTVSWFDALAAPAFP